MKRILLICFMAVLLLPTRVQAAETIDAYLGAYDPRAELEAHTDDEKYLGTPGWPEDITGCDYEDCCYYGTAAYNEAHGRDQGVNPEGAGSMNCAGFIGDIFEAAGADLVSANTRFVNEDVCECSSHFTDAVNWQYTALRSTDPDGSPSVLYYQYDSIEALIRDGAARKGDVLLVLPAFTGQAFEDYHMLFYWGADGSSDTSITVWHSAGYYDCINQIETMDQEKLMQYTGTVGTIYLLPITQYGKLRVKGFKSGRRYRCYTDAACTSPAAAEQGTFYFKIDAKGSGIAYYDQDDQKIGKSVTLAEGIYYLKDETTGAVSPVSVTEAGDLRIFRGILKRKEKMAYER